MIAAIIQAQMGSSRLPGKSMMPICGKPMLAHVVERVRKAVDEVFIVTTPDSKGIINFAWDNDIIVSLDRRRRDVLDSYYNCACENGITHIVRVTADNPLIDPDVISGVVNYYLTHIYDHVSNCRLKATYPIGQDVEMFSFRTLEKAWQEAVESYEREHVTPYIYRHPELFRLANLENKVDLSHLRWTVDTQEDFDFATKVYEQLYHGQVFHMNEVLELIRRESWHKQFSTPK